MTPNNVSDVLQRTVLFLNLVPESIFEWPNSPRPIGEYATIGINNMEQVGWGEESDINAIDGDLDRKHDTLYNITIGVKFFRGDALTNISLFSKGLVRNDVLEFWNEEGVSLVSRTSIVNIVCIINAEYENRTRMEVTMQALITESDEKVLAAKSTRIKGEIHNLSGKIEDVYIGPTIYEQRITTDTAAGVESVLIDDTPLGSPPFDVTSLTYTGDNYNVGAVSGFHCLSWIGDGTKFYTSDSNFSNPIRQFNLNVAWLPSSSSFSGNSFDPTPAVFPTRGLFIKLDGSGFWLAGTSEGKRQIHQYSMVGGEINSGVFTSKVLDLTPQGITRPDGLFLSNDYSKCYVTENYPAQSIFQYNLTVPGEIDTGVFVGSLNTAIGNIVDYPISCYIRQNDQLKLFVSGLRDFDGEGLIAEFDLSIPGKIYSPSGAVYNGVTALTSPPSYEPSMTFRSDGLRVLVSDSGSDEVYEYST